MYDWNPLRREKRDGAGKKVGRNNGSEFPQKW